MASVVFNKISINKKLSDSIKSTRFKGLATRAATTRFVFAKSAMIEAFNEHPVTQEIEAGTTAQGGLLSKGNIFSFIGFNQGDEPTEKLRSYLESNVRMETSPKFIQNQRNVVYQFNVRVPNLNDIYSNSQFRTPDNWSTDSWPALIEKGINNFSYYVFLLVGNFSSGSRSGTGLQNTKSKNGSAGKALGIPYLSDVLSRFRSYFKSK